MGCSLREKGQRALPLTRLGESALPCGRALLEPQNHGLLGQAEHQDLLLRDNSSSSPNTITRDLIQEL